MGRVWSILWWILGERFVLIIKRHKHFAVVEMCVCVCICVYTCTIIWWF